MFEDIYDLLPNRNSEGLDILDVGSGCGHFLEYLVESDCVNGTIRYKGIDCHFRMIQATIKMIKKYSRTVDAFAEFSTLSDYTKEHDYVVASGTFNLKISDNHVECLIQSVDHMCKIAKKGVVFNLLTLNDKSVLGRDLLFYDINLIFNYLIDKYNDVRIRANKKHDYFTVVIPTETKRIR
jgi:hypothetical protein